MKVAAIGMTSGDDVERNVARAFELVDAAKGAELVCLPEFFPHFNETRQDVVPRMCAKARQRRIWLSGSLLLGTPRPSNTLVVVSPEGDVVAQYRKIHLFDAFGIRESDHMAAGDTPMTCDIGGWRTGLAICYDLRFPELFRALAADLYLTPSAFSDKTGPAHWHVLVRARAIENQAYVVAAAQGGEHPRGRRTYGHPLIVDPWGDVLAEGGEIAIAKIDRARLEEVRAKLPALRYRRDFGA